MKTKIGIIYYKLILKVSSNFLKFYNLKEIYSSSYKILKKNKINY